MRAVDTNVLLRLLVRDDKVQAAAAEGFISHGAWVSTLALAETVWVLRSGHKRTPAELADTIEFLMQHKSLVLQDSDAVASALKSFRSRQSLGFSDCLLVELARKAGHLPFGTFDRTLAKIDGAEKL